jgi:hypothetical protein
MRRQSRRTVCCFCAYGPNEKEHCEAVDWGACFLSRRLEVRLLAEEQEQAQADRQIAGDHRDHPEVYLACREVPALPGFI